MKKSIKVLFMSVILMVSIVLGGCSKSSKPADNSISDGTAANVITDMGGFEVTLPDKIERVVSTSDPCTDMMVAFGQSDKLVGSYFRALENPWFSVFCKNVDEITAFDSYEPESEALIALNTDIIFVPSSERAESLREKGICAITIRYYNPDEVLYAAKMLGQIFGGTAKEKSEEWIEDFNSARESVSEKISDISDDKKPVVYEILADKDRGPFRTYYGDNQAWLSYAGGILATKDFADATSQAMPTEESILATNPKIIFIGGLYATKEYASLLENEMWAEIDAVESGNIFIEPTGALAWNMCSTCYPLLIYYCFSCMYPDRADFDLNQLSHDFYQNYYGIDFSDAQMELMMNSKAPDGTELWKE